MKKEIFVRHVRNIKLGVLAKAIIICISLMGTSHLAHAGCNVVWSSSATWNGVNWGVGSTRYTVNSTVSHGGKEYRVKAIPGFNCSPTDPTYAHHYWTYLGSCATKPSISTKNITSITSSSSLSGGSNISSGGAHVTKKGVCWVKSSVSSYPKITNSKTTNGSGTSSFNSSITGLLPNTEYHVRAYATNSVGTSYGARKTFTTLANPPTVSTNNISSITSSSASSGGNVTANGGLTVTARGVCWSTSSNPTISNSKTTNGSGNGSFSSSITGLSPYTTYYVRAYATNSVGTSYGAQKTFTTLANLPTISTTDISSITSTSASSGGNVTANGGATVTARGVCWSTSSNPTISNSKTTNGSGNGSFSSSITGLTGNMVYYVRAYATNVAGTAYGTQKTFTTAPIIPTVTTASVSSTTCQTSSSGGNVTSNGGATVTARGICWSTSSSPTISDSKTTDGSGNGSFSSSLSGLTASTTFYVRAYATNSVGTAYGNEVTVSTLNATTAGGIGTNQTICHGTAPNTLTETIEPSDGTGNYTYQWKSSPNNSTWSNVSTNATYTPGTLTQNTYFRRDVTSGDCGTATSASVLITVSSPSDGGTLPSNVIVCSGSNGGTLTLSGYVGGIMRWESSTDNWGTVNTISNTTNTQNYSNVATETKYRVVVQASPCSETTSNEATISIAPDLNPGVIRFE